MDHADVQADGLEHLERLPSNIMTSLELQEGREAVLTSRSFYEHLDAAFTTLTFRS